MGCEGCDVNTNDSAHQLLIVDVVRPAGKVVVFGIGLLPSRQQNGGADVAYSRSAS